MKKTYKMKDIDCANCAAKMEKNIKKIDGVEDASINFMTQKLTIEADEESFGEILEQAARIVKKIEPDCEIVVR